MIQLDTLGREKLLCGVPPWGEPTQELIRHAKYAVYGKRKPSKEPSDGGRKRRSARMRS